SGRPSYAERALPRCRGPHMEESASEAPAKSATHVFVSYARADEKQAKAIIACIEQAGLEVWWDGLIPGGERFSAKIAEALEGADAIVVLWSRHSVASNWVQDEASWGRDHNRLIPISLDGTAPPLGFRQLQCVDLSKGVRPSNPELQRALRAIVEIVGRPPVPSSAAGRAPLRIDRRTMVAGGAAVAVAVAGFGAWRWGGSAGASHNSIAVLPFDNVGG